MPWIPSDAVRAQATVDPRPIKPSNHAWSTGLLQDSLEACRSGRANVLAG